MTSQTTVLDPVIGSQPGPSIIVNEAADAMLHREAAVEEDGEVLVTVGVLEAVGIQGGVLICLGAGLADEIGVNDG